MVGGGGGGGLSVAPTVLHALSSPDQSQGHGMSRAHISVCLRKTYILQGRGERDRKGARHRQTETSRPVYIQTEIHLH